MREENGRVREKFELSLDGRQIASIVVGALVILGVVFVLGLNVGKQIAVRQAAAARSGDLDALDRGPAPAPSGGKDEAITFYDKLPKAKPAAAPAPAAPEPARAAPRAPEPAPAAAPPAPEPAAVAAAPAPAAPAAAAATPTPVVAASTSASAAEAAHPAKAPAPQRGAWCVQLASAQDRGEAEKLARKYERLSPRVEAADVPGKGRFYRVRAGAFESREAAQRWLQDVVRGTGAKGYVTPSR